MRRFFTTIVLALVAITVCHQAKADEVNIRHLDKQTGLTGDEVTTLAQDHYGYIWAGTTNGLNRIDGHEVYTWDSPKHPLHNLPIRAIEVDKENNCLWIFSPKRMVGCLMLASNELIPYKSEKADTLFNNYHKGKLYVWQYGPGKRCSRTRLNKGLLTTETFKQEIVDICTDEGGNDWLLTRNGLYLNGFKQKLPSSDNVTHISTYRNICLALTPHEIIIYNHSRRIARRTPFPAGYRNTGECTDLATWGDQLLIFTPERTVAYHVLDATFSAPSKIQLRGGRVLPESKKNLYVHNEKGRLIRLGENGTVHSLQLMSTEIARQLSDNVPQVCAINATTEAFGTNGNGLHLLNLNTGKSIHHQKERKEKTHDFIHDNRIKALLADHTGCLWIATHQSGLTCIRPSSQTEGSDNPAPIHAPRLLITTVTVDGEKSLIDTDEMALSYTHNNVEWHFSCLTYDRMEDAHYQFYLAGHDSTWQAATRQHTAKYKELSPGRYTFHVKASMDGTHWGKESTHTIVIGEPWWSQWPAYLAILAIFTAMGLFLYLIVHRFIHPDLQMDNGLQTAKKPLERAEASDTPSPSSDALAVSSEQIDESASSIKEKESTDKVADQPHLTAKDERFKQLLDKLIEENIERPDFGVEEFAASANLKRTQFYTKVKRITGLSPIELLRKAHLEQAAKLLTETDMNIDEVRERCGFSNSTTFYNYFKQQYGMTPRQYRQGT